MALFELLSREEFDITPEETQQPEEIHPSVPEKLITEENEDQVKLLSSIMGTIDSLESLKANLVLARESGYRLSPTEVTALSQRVSLAYQRSGVPEQMPLHVSTESVLVKNPLSVTIEQINYRIEMLSTEADNIFRRMWEKLKDVFGNELNRVENLKGLLDRSIARLSKAKDTGKRTIGVKGGDALEINGKQNIGGIITTLNQLNATYLQDGKVIRFYREQLDKFGKFVSSTVVDNKEEAKSKILSGNFFTLGKPFLKTGQEEGYRKYECIISDLNSIKITMPTGEGKLYPHVRSKKSDNSGLRNKIKKGGVTKITASKDEVLAHLKQLRASLDALPDAPAMEKITSLFRQQIKEIENTNIPLQAAQKELKKWDDIDKTRIKSSLMVGLPLLVATGGIAGVMWVASTISAVVTIPAAAQEDTIVQKELNENNFGEGATTLAFLQGALFGPGFGMAAHLAKKAIYGIESKMTVYFVDFYRSYYTALASTGRALVNLANELEKEQ